MTTKTRRVKETQIEAHSPVEAIIAHALEQWCQTPDSIREDTEIQLTKKGNVLFRIGTVTYKIKVKQVDT